MKVGKCGREKEGSKREREDLCKREREDLCKRERTRERGIRERDSLHEKMMIYKLLLKEIENAISSEATL